MRRLRLPILILALVAALGAYYYHFENRVRLETVEFRSRLAGRVLPYRVLLPPGYRLITSRRTRYPVVYLLHGYGHNHTSWTTQTSLAHYAAAHQLIVVMPTGDNGWYTDSATVEADKFETYILEELIPDVQRRFRTVETRAGRTVAGISMGGYGALKFGFKHPEAFAVAASLSGALDAAARTDDPSIMRAFGDAGSPTREANDLFRLARDFPAERRGVLPFFYFDCGAQDPWMESNRTLASIFLERKLAHEFRQLPGEHIWPYWDRQVQEVLRLAAERTTP
jgi:S-formylglutathione hydrolase FrmB